MKNVKYMHTIDGQPGNYRGGQICFSVVTQPIQLADSLEQIRREQKASDRWRAIKGYGVARVQFGYRRVRVA